jgi:glycosyl hydrolase family 25
LTIFGPDISSFQRGLVLSHLASAAFVIAKTTEGTYYAEYQGWRQQCAGSGKPFIWYHFLSGQTAAAQVAHTLANVGDRALPGMLDAEPQDQTGFKPTWAQIIGYIDAAHAAGLNLRLLYLPRWYWDQIGRPDLSVLAPRRVYLVSSAYPGGGGGAAALYPGDSAAGWQSYGGAGPLLYQFTNQATDGGQPLDYNAFRGSLDQLRAYLQAATSAPSPSTPTTVEDDDMPAFSEGRIAPGTGVTTVVCPPPANYGAAGWGNVWFSLGSDFGDAHVRVAAFVKNVWTNFHLDLVVPAAGPRVHPFGAPLPPDVEKISIKRLDGSENVPMAYLIEAAHR